MISQKKCIVYWCQNITILYSIMMFKITIEIQINVLCGCSCQEMVKEMSPSSMTTCYKCNVCCTCKDLFGTKGKHLSNSSRGVINNSPSVLDFNIYWALLNRNTGVHNTLGNTAACNSYICSTKCYMKHHRECVTCNCYNVAYCMVWTLVVKTLNLIYENNAEI